MSADININIITTEGIPKGSALLVSPPAFIVPHGEDLFTLEFVGNRIVARVNPRARLREGSVAVIRGLE